MIADWCASCETVVRTLAFKMSFDDWTKRVWWSIALKTWIKYWLNLSTLKYTDAKLIKIFLDRSFALNDFNEHFFIECVLFNVQLNQTIIFKNNFDTIQFFMRRKLLTINNIELMILFFDQLFQQKNCIYLTSNTSFVCQFVDIVFFSNFSYEIFVTYFSNVWSSILIFKYVFHSFFNE